MALGTNYKRNVDKAEAAIQNRINKAKELAKELNGNYALAADVILGRVTIEQARKSLLDGVSNNG